MRDLYLMWAFCFDVTVVGHRACEILKLQKMNGFLSVKEQLLCGSFFKHIHHTSKQMLVRLQVCSSTKISIATPWMVTGNSGGGGVSKAKLLKLKWNFLKSGGSSRKTLREKGMDIFWNHTFHVCL